jgi:hypothetical protein
MASITVIDGGAARTVAYSDERAMGVDKEQYAAGDGPCLRAAATPAVGVRTVPGGPVSPAGQVEFGVAGGQGVREFGEFDVEFL